MGQRAIDELWTEWRVDRQVRAVLEGIATDDAFLRLIARKVDGLTAADVRASLRRAQFRVDYPAIGDIVEPAHGVASPALADVEPARAPPGNGAAGPALPSSSQGNGASAATEEPTSEERTGLDEPRSKRYLMRTGEMLERGLITPGVRLKIRGRPNSEATVVDGRHVEFGGELMSYNDWGCRVTGWTAIQIYEWAEMPDGRLLSALRAT